MSSLQIGIARTDITPPVGIPMVGFAGRGPSTQVHDPLYATALVALEDDKSAALIALDLLGLKAETIAEIRHTIHTATDISPERIGQLVVDPLPPGTRPASPGQLAGRSFFAKHQRRVAGLVYGRTISGRRPGRDLHRKRRFSERTIAV